MKLICLPTGLSPFSEVVCPAGGEGGMTVKIARISRQFLRSMLEENKNLWFYNNAREQISAPVLPPPLATPPTAATMQHFGPHSGHNGRQTGVCGFRFNANSWSLSSRHECQHEGYVLDPYWMLAHDLHTSMNGNGGSRFHSARISTREI